MSEQNNTNPGALTPDHPVWSLFCDLLFERLGSDLPGECRHDHRYTRAVLAEGWPPEEGDFDADATVRYFERHGGYCDCEVLFNVGTPRTVGGPAAA